MEESHKNINKRKSQIHAVHTVWLYLNEIQKQTKLIYGNKSQNGGWPGWEDAVLIDKEYKKSWRCFVSWFGGGDTGVHTGKNCAFMCCYLINKKL